MNPALVSQSPLAAQSLQYWFVSSHIEPVDQKRSDQQICTKCSIFVCLKNGGVLSVFGKEEGFYHL